MREIKYHIIHCSDSTFGDVKEIRKWHLARGFKDIGYHFIIRQDGEIEMGRALNEIGAHCRGHNMQSVGTCLIGQSKFTAKQFTSLEKIHHMLKALFKGVQLKAHCELNSDKTCPNFNPHER
jgi:N-acetylmuramoyl-L-alanine amidase